MDGLWWIAEESTAVAYTYLSPQRDQLLLMAVSMRDWLEEGHLAWFIIDVVSELDTSAFDAIHPNDGAGVGGPAGAGIRRHQDRRGRRA